MKNNAFLHSDMGQDAEWILVQHKLQVTGIRRGPSLPSDPYPLIVQIQRKM
ncbi:MAG: hypothetical protein PHV34_11750 [Verrucomicrobiae bacterium]|nr:hypothetical protein [Verrucomicrobiae bacterium]